MDSITQIVLGAAVGEAVLGKKTGNRALWWGGVAGTIPDLDVLANLVFPEMQALALHRHFTHSIAFSILGGWAMAWLVYRYYETGIFRKPLMVHLKGILFIGFIVIYALSMVGISWWLRGIHALFWIIPLAVVLFFVARYYYRSFILTLHYPPHGVSLYSWFLLFFWCFITHALLDVFTPYGTQVFQPFSDYRAAFNNISVVDPLYTLPLLIAVLVIVFIRRDHPMRSRINTLGLILSCFYMVLTLVNKFHVNRVFENTLQEQGITVNRYMTSPGIMNNALWNAVAETDTSFIMADYSMFDPQRRFSGFREVPKNHHLLDNFGQHRDIEIAQWFTNHYYSVDPHEDEGKLYISDLRYGAFSSASTEDEPLFVFRFVVEKQNGTIQVSQSRDRPEITLEAWQNYWSRVFGRTAPQ